MGLAYIYQIAALAAKEGKETAQDFYSPLR